MSLLQAQKDYDVAFKAVADAEREAHTKESAALTIRKKISALEQQIARTTSASTLSSYRSQLSSRHTELVRANTALSTARKKVAVMQSTATEKREKLLAAERAESKTQEEQRKKFDQATKKQRDEDARFAKQQETALGRQLVAHRAINAETRRSGSAFGARIAETPWERIADEDTIYSYDEAGEVRQRIEEVLKRLEDLGQGQSRLFDEIESLKDKANKVSRKDLRLLTVGTLMSYGSGVVDPANLVNFFTMITGAMLPGMLGEG